MLCRTIWLCLFVFVFVKCDIETPEPMEIRFVISETANLVTCDHGLKKLNKYTVLEGEYVTINITYNSNIHGLRCIQLNNEKHLLFNETGLNNVNVNVKVEINPRMGTVWDCEIWTHEVDGNDGKQTKYISPHCYMQLHVKRITALQMILVNNVISQPVRTDLSEQHVDFRLEHEYADNDVVEVTCIKNTLDYCELSLEYNYAGMLNDTNIKHLRSNEALGIRIRLHSDHHNSGITCKCKGTNDFTNVQVTFTIKTQFSCSMSVIINGLNLRQKYNTIQGSNDFCEINYNAVPTEKIHLTCKSNRDDWRLQIKEDSYILSNGSKITEMTFKTDPLKKLMKCLAIDQVKNTIAERIEINLAPFNKLMDVCQLVVEMPKDNIVMELFELKKQRIIYYEFEDGDSVTMNCYTRCTANQVRVYWKISDLYLSDPSKETAKNQTHTMTLSNKHLCPDHACYLYTNSEPIRETRIVFIEKVRSTTEPDLAAPIIEENSKSDIPIWVWILAGMMICFIVISISAVIYNMKKRNIQQETRENLNHRFPPHLENNYEVPIDQRQDDTTYCEPCENLYTDPIPKTARQKKTINTTYASADLHTSHSQKNTIKIDDDPNYAEVLPKTKRPSNAYAHVENNTYANIGQEIVEPTYCEPTAQKGFYQNVVNQGHYVNKTGDVDYVEPTYCENNTKRK